MLPLDTAGIQECGFFVPGPTQIPIEDGYSSQHRASGPLPALMEGKRSGWPLCWPPRGRFPPSRLSQAGQDIAAEEGAEKSTEEKVSLSSVLARPECCHILSELTNEYESAVLLAIL